MKKSVLLILAAALVFAEPEEKSAEHKSFSGVHELIIDNVNGVIEVTGSSGGSVEVDIAKTLKARTQDRIALARREVKLDVTQEGGLVRLKVDYPFRDHGGPGYDAIYDFRVRVPRDIRLDLHSLNSRIASREPRETSRSVT